MIRLWFTLAMAFLPMVSVAAPVTSGFDIKAGDSTLSGTLRFETGGGPISGRVAIRTANDPGNPPQRNNGTAVTGIFDIQIALDGTFSGGPTGILLGNASMQGSFTDSDGCVASVSGTGSFDGDIILPRGNAFAWSEWGQLNFSGCDLASEQPFSVEYLPFSFTPTDEIPQRAANAPPLPIKRDPATIARRDRRDDNQSGPSPDDTGVDDGDDTSKVMTLLSASRSVRAGEVVQSPIYLNTANNVGNINFEIKYDPGIVTPVDKPIKGNILSSSSLLAGSSSESGVIRIGFAGTEGISGDGTVAEVRFRAVGQPGDISPLELMVTKIDDPSGGALEIVVQSGQITIVDESGLVPGDGDGDGKVTTLDALLALQMSVKLIPEKLQLDLDEDGTVTSRDAVLILQLALGG